MNQTSKVQHLDRLSDRLGREFSSVVPRDAVVEVVHAEYERLSRESRVPDFIPILAERRARARLRRPQGEPAERRRT